MSGKKNTPGWNAACANLSRNARWCPASGLEHPRAVVALAERLLPSGGLLLMEHGAGQGEAARGLCGTAWSLALTGKDYAGLDRYLLAIRGQVRERNIPAAANPCGDTGQEVTTHEPASGI